MSYLCGAVKHMPIILCILTPISVFITYGIATAKDHVSPLWPYISDTGTKPPESCVFALLLNGVAFLLCSIIYLRYREVSEFKKIKPTVKISPLCNRTAAVLGFVSCFGLDLVANFQETNEFLVHIIGALLCFFSGTLYFLVQTVFTYKMYPQAKVILWLRIVFTILNVLFIIGTFAPIHAAFLEFKGNDVLKWTIKDGGFTYHATSTFSEWFLVFSFCAYVCTLFWDFRKIEIEPLRIKFYDLEGLKYEEDNPNELNSDLNEVGRKSLWI